MNKVCISIAFGPFMTKTLIISKIGVSQSMSIFWEFASWRTFHLCDNFKLAWLSLKLSKVNFSYIWQVKLLTIWKQPIKMHRPCQNLFLKSIHSAGYRSKFHACMRAPDWSRWLAAKISASNIWFITSNDVE